MPFTLINNILSFILKFHLFIQLLLKLALTQPTCTYKLATMTPLKRTFFIFLNVDLAAHLLSQKKSFLLTTLFLNVFHDQPTPISSFPAKENSPFYLFFNQNHLLHLIFTTTFSSLYTLHLNCTCSLLTRLGD